MNNRSIEKMADRLKSDTDTVITELISEIESLEKTIDEQTDRIEELEKELEAANETISDIKSD